MDPESALECLRDQLAAAREQAKRTSDAFDAIVREVPSGIPYPDSVQRIRDASREYNSARVSLTIALKRLNDFQVRGIIPDDLK
jgi:hypothetical protein